MVLDPVSLTVMARAIHSLTKVQTSQRMKTETTLTEKAVISVYARRGVQIESVNV